MDLETSVLSQGDKSSILSFVIGSTQQAAIADALSSTGALWQSTIDFARPSGHHGSLLSDERSAVHSITKDYYQPYSSVYCVRDMIQGQNDQKPMAFPVSIYVDYKSNPDLLKHVNATVQGFPATEYPSILRGQLLNLPGPDSTNRFKWVRLPQDIFPGNSVGLIVLLPPDPNDLPKQNTTSMLVCNIGAGWGASSIKVTSYDHGMSDTSSVFNIDANNLYLGMSGRASGDVPQYQANTPKSVYYNPPFYPSKSIEIGVEWAEYLNPFVPGVNTSAIDFLLKGMNNSVIPAEQSTEYILAGLLANGLARVGFRSQFQGDIKMVTLKNGMTVPDATFWATGKGNVFTVDPDESKDWVKLRVDSTMEGYAYNTSGPSPKIAIAFLLAYCMLALAHTFYSGISGISSTCWDSIAEVTALAVNSQPTTILRNTCAGISEIRIFKTPVRILAMSDDEGEGEHLEMVFGDVDEELAEKKSIKAGRIYGTMPALGERLKVL